MTPRQREILKFGVLMFLMLLTVAVTLIVVLDIRFGPPPPPPTEPREFDLSSLNTITQTYDRTRGLVAVRSIANVPASGRCAIVVESLEHETAPGYHFVANALEHRGSSLTGYPVQTKQLEDLVADCLAAGDAAELVSSSAQDVMSEVRLRVLEEEKQRAAEERASRPAKPDGQNPLTGIIEQVNGGDLEIPDTVTDIFRK